MDKYIDMFSVMIKDFRIGKGYKQERMAELLGISLRHYQNIERGLKIPGSEILYKLVYELGLRPDLVFSLERHDKDQKHLNLCHLLNLCSPEQIDVLTATACALLKLPNMN